MNVAPEHAQDLFISLTIFRYGVVAVYALQVYEWLLTFSEEVYLVHHGRWTSVKVAYLICRYYPLILWPLYVWAWVGNHEENLCARLIHPLYCLVIPFQLSPQAVILIRSYAFSGRRRVVLAMLGMCFLVLLATEIIAFALHIQSAASFLHPFFGDTGCLRDLYNGGFPSITRTGVVLVSTLCLDVICMAVVLLHCVRIQGVQGSLGKSFLTHGISAFVVTSIVNLFAAIQYFRPLRYGVGIHFVFILNNIVACRLILHLRRRVFLTETQQEREQSRVVREALDALQDGESDSTILDEWAYPFEVSASAPASA